MQQETTRMIDQTEVERYNYAVFQGSDNFFAFRTVLRVGDLAPDGELVALDSGQPVRLSEFWRERDILIEFGSLT